MRKYFDHAYEGFCNSLQSFVYLAEVLGGIAIVVLVYVTLPIWVIPYHIFLRRKESGLKDENTYRQ